MTLGTAIRLGQMIEFQKEAELPQDPLERHCSRGLFWAIFTVDRLVSHHIALPSQPAGVHSDLDTLPRLLDDH